MQNNCFSSCKICCITTVFISHGHWTSIFTVRFESNLGLVTNLRNLERSTSVIGMFNFWHAPIEDRNNINFALLVLNSSFFLLQQWHQVNLRWTCLDDLQATSTTTATPVITTIEKHNSNNNRQYICPLIRLILLILPGILSKWLRVVMYFLFTPADLLLLSTRPLILHLNLGKKEMPLS